VDRSHRYIYKGDVGKKEIALSSLAGKKKRGKNWLLDQREREAK